MNTIDSAIMQASLTASCTTQNGKNYTIDFGRVHDITIQQELNEPTKLISTLSGTYRINKNEPTDVKKTFTPQYIKQDGLHTIVRWEDGEVTHVKASEGDTNDGDAYMAFCAALAKKIFGTNSAVHRVVDRHTTEYLEAQKKKERAEVRRQEEERNNLVHKRKVMAVAKQLRLKEEAKEYNRQHRYNDED